MQSCSHTERTPVSFSIFFILNQKTLLRSCSTRQRTPCVSPAPLPKPSSSSPLPHRPCSNPAETVQLEEAAWREKKHFRRRRQPPHSGSGRQHAFWERKLAA